MAINRKERIIHPENLDGYVAYWQKRLRLSHWHISARIARAKEMGDNNGTNNYNTALMQCEILLLDPDDYDDYGAYDMEFILVHELLHLIIEVHRHSSTYDERQEIDMEAAINSIAWTLMDYEMEKEDKHDANDH